MTDSLLKCTLRKSGNVLKKVLKYAGIGVAAALLITAAAQSLIVGMRILLDHQQAFTAAQDYLIGLGQGILTVLLGIPWYYYAIAFVILAIPVYSLLWCIARDLTDKDYRSRAAVSGDNIFTIIVIIAHILLVIANIFTINTIYLFLLLSVQIASIVLVIIIFSSLDDDNSIWYRIFRFPGAIWHHYVTSRREKS